LSDQPRPDEQLEGMPGLSELPLNAMPTEVAAMSNRTPRNCQHTPRPTSTFEACGSLGGTLARHSSAVLWNPRAPRCKRAGARAHVPAAFSYCRGLFSDDEVAQLRAIHAEASGSEGASIGLRRVVEGSSAAHLRGRSEPLWERFPEYKERLLGLKDAFGLRCELERSELERVRIGCDLSFTRLQQPGESPWAEHDGRSHFMAVVMLSDPGLDFGGGVLALHCGACPSDGDAMPVPLAAGDVAIWAACRMEHAVQAVEWGERLCCTVEFELDESVDTPPLGRANAVPASTPRDEPEDEDFIE
jgi:hypothetical protein